MCTIFYVEHMLNGGMPNAPSLKVFFSTIIRLACRSQNVVRILTLSKYPQFSPLFSPPIAISFKVEIFLSNMLTINGGSQFSSPKRIFFCNNRTRNVVWILPPNFTNFYIIGGETDDRRKKSLQGGTFGIPPFIKNSEHS